MKRVLRAFSSIGISLLLVLSMASAGYAKAGGFPDVAPTDWYYNAVEYVADKGFFSGLEDGRFRPQGIMNRAMMVTALANGSENYERGDTLDAPFLHGISNNLDPLSFTDVRQYDDWYGNPVLWADWLKITYGRGGNRFEPLAPITREEAIVMLYRYADKTGNDIVHAGISLNSFTDSDGISSWAADAMDWAVEHGVLKGYPDGTLRPDKPLTRAEAAGILYGARNALTSAYVTWETPEALIKGAEGAAEKWVKRFCEEDKNREVLDWFHQKLKVYEISKDGNSMCFSLVLFFKPENYNYVDWWTGNAKECTGELKGYIQWTRQMKAEKNANGWLVVDTGTGGIRLEPYKS